jgi:hypothetical protein
MRCSLATTAVDRRGDYLAKPEVRQAPDYNARHLRGWALQLEMTRRWGKQPERTNPDVATENRA